jgi:hypothetical protein
MLLSYTCSVLIQVLLLIYRFSSIFRVYNLTLVPVCWNADSLTRLSNQ